MNTRVTAEAWIRVSRSGHWTRFSSAQQETRKPITAPRWRSCGSAAVCRRFSDSLRRRSRSFSSRRRSRRLIRSGAASAGTPTSAREGAGARSSSALRRVPPPGRAPPARLPPADSLQRLEVGSVLGQLRLDHLGRLRDLGPLLGTAVGARARAAPRERPAPLALAALPSAALESSPPLHQSSLSASPCEGCAGRTSGSTCAARAGRECCAATCWSGSCVACTPRRRASRRFGLLRGPLAGRVPLFGPGGRRFTGRAPLLRKKTPPLALRRGGARWPKDSAPTGPARASPSIPAGAALRAPASWR